MKPITLPEPAAAFVSDGGRDVDTARMSAPRRPSPSPISLVVQLFTSSEHCMAIRITHNQT
jgi:hypothetical protein